MTTKKKYPSIDQNKLKVLCDILCDKITDLLDCLDVEYKENGKMITMACPIHDGDNKSAVNIYHEGDMYRGNWKCRTHCCEESFKDLLLDLLEVFCLLNVKDWMKPGDEMVSFKETLDFCTKFANQDLDDIKINEVHTNKKNFTNVINNISNKPEKHITYISRNQIRSSLEIPSQYYIDRGYSSRDTRKIRCWELHQT